MRLITGTGQYDMEIQGDGVFTEDPTPPAVERPEFIPGPELGVIESTTEPPDETERVRNIIHGVIDVPNLPEVPGSGFWRKDAEEKPFNN